MKSEYQPLVSILIPLRNEAAYLERCLDCVLRQDYPPEKIEILISDGMSTDGTRAVIQRFSANEPRIRVFDNPQQIVSTGLNILIPQAAGEVFIRVDGHCLIAENYVSKCVNHLQQDQVQGVGGPMRSIGEDFISQVIATAMSSHFGVGNSIFRTQTNQTRLADTVPFPAYPKVVVNDVGLYDEELVRDQDDEYNYRIREAGGQLLLADDVRSTYFSRGTLGKLWSQYFQYGYWKVRVLQKHPHQMSLRQFVPPAFVFGIGLLLLFSLLVQKGWFFLLTYLGVYLMANLIASLSLAGKNGLKNIIVLPAAFAILHVSYGSGFLFGLVRFRNRWGDKTGKVPTHL